MTTHEELDARDFGHPFLVTADGTFEEAPVGTYAPDVYDASSISEDITIMGTGWEALTGYTGQYGYNGAVMHASEFIGGKLADDILATPGVYVVVVVEVLPVDDPESCPHIMDGDACAECGMGAESAELDGCTSHPDYDDGSQPAGWAILRQVEV